jgi:hypothetical protein
MTFKLTIRLGNDAMSTWFDIANALRTVAGQVQDLGDVQITTEDSHTASVIMDDNGNSCGKWETR